MKPCNQRFSFVLSHLEKGMWTEHKGYLWACNITEARRHVQCLSRLYMPSTVVKSVDEADERVLVPQD
jgi:hypothetical protein